MTQYLDPKSSAPLQGRKRNSAPAEDVGNLHRGPMSLPHLNGTVNIVIRLGPLGRAYKDPFSPQADQPVPKNDSVWKCISTFQRAYNEVESTYTSLWVES